MILVVTRGSGSLDQYSQRLAEHLPDVEQWQTDIYATVAESFNRPLLSRDALVAAVRDWRYRQTLAQATQPVHLPNHHMGRYAKALRVPYVVTVHDLIRVFDLQRARPLIHRPNLRDRLLLKEDLHGIHNADRIIAVSHTTASDLVEYLGVPTDRITVVYEGVDHGRFHPVAGAAPFPFPYVLYVGSEHPRKNMPVLLEALRDILASGAAPELRLVKVGRAGGAEDDFRRRTRREIERFGLRDAVHFAGYVDEAELPAYYAGAVCTVMPSIYEGFGLPVLEAMASGSPVIVSSGGSLPEIAGMAGLVVSPRDPKALAEAIVSLIQQPERREELTRLGIARAAEFSWERTAQETRQVYEAIEVDFAERRRTPPTDEPRRIAAAVAEPAAEEPQPALGTAAG